MSGSGGQKDTPLHDVQFLEVAISSSNLGFVVWDEQQNLVACSKTCPDFWYEPQHILKPGMPMLELLRHIAHKGGFGPGDSEEQARRELERVRQAGPDSEDEFEMLDGRVIHVQRNVMQGGGHASTYTDITARKQAEYALRESEERFRELASLLPLSICETDQTGTITYANQQSLASFGYALEELTGDLNVMDMIAPEERERATSNAMEAMKGGKERLSGTEYTAVGKDGSEFPVLIYTAPIIAGGKPVGMRNAIVDITERKKFERELQRAALVTEQMSEGVLVVGVDDIVSDCNLAAEKLFGYSKAELVGMSPSVFHDSQTSEAERQKIVDIIGRRGSWQGEIDVVRKDGAKRKFDVAISEFSDDTGTVIGRIGINRDVTERRELEAHLSQVQRNDAIAKLTGGVAHDFNNLLQVVITNLNFLRQGGHDEDKRRKMLNLSLEAAQRGAEVTHRLLAYTQQQMLAPEVVDLNELVANVVELLRPSLGDTVAIETKLADRPLSSRIDSGQVQDALINLALNARDAMPEGGQLKFEVAEGYLDDSAGGARSESRSGSYVMVAAHDTGCGIPADIIDRVQDPFFTTKGRANASGLGLSMVHGFAGQSGGHLAIESDVGVGTSVRLYLPKIEEEGVATTTIDEPASFSGSETVLLVEDDAAVLDSLAFGLEWFGYKVVMAEDGAKALSILEESSVAVLITDVSMPGGMSGTELAQVVREDHPELPVIFITGYTHDIDEITGSREGDQLLYKPFRDDELAMTVRRALAG